MGLYDENGSYDGPNNDEIGKDVAKAARKPSKGFNNSKGIFSNFSIPSIVPKIILGVLVTFIVVIVVYAGYVAIQPNMISYTLKPNPVFMSDETVSNLKVTIKNTEDYTIKNIKVNVRAIDSVSVVAIPSTEINIPVLGPDEKRVLEYTLETVGEIPEGEYAIIVSAKTPENTYDESIIWEVKKTQG